MEVLLKTLKQMREKAGFSKAEMARFVGKTAPTWANWESGQSKMPADVAIIVADKLDEDVEDVLMAVAR
jgi:DNA-binding XRE family transcriptional regulator